MVAPGTLYLLVATVLALVAHGAAVPVLAGIVRDGRERLRRGGPKPPTADDIADAGCVRCRHCGAVNESEYVYCGECSGAL